MTHPLVEPSGEICTLQTLSLIWASPSLRNLFNTRRVSSRPLQ